MNHAKFAIPLVARNGELSMRKTLVTAAFAALVTAGCFTVANATTASPGLLVKANETSVTQVRWRHRHVRVGYRPRVYGYRYARYYRPRVYGFYAPRVYGWRGYRGCRW
jgi:hypothetical protein